MNPDKYHIPRTYHSNQIGLHGWLNGLCKYLHINSKAGKVEYPDSFANGFVKVHDIEPGFSYRVVDYSLNTDFTFTRGPAENFFLLIYFYQYTEVDKLFISAGEEVIIDTTENNFSAALMVSSLSSQRIELSKGTRVRGLTIELTEEWLKEKIEISHDSDCQVFEVKNIFKDVIAAKTQKLLNEIFADNLVSPTPGFSMNIRVQRILEEFLRNLINSDLSQNPSSLSKEDFESILKIEALLVENYTSVFPTIENLARIALMSETKLKNVFKKAFGMGLYEYYQKNRMHKAKELLNMNKYSVSEVGSMIGYQNLSNFSNAFKKEFGYLPKNSDQIG
ncbi:MAG: helix-turn-helix transcriptional regulator [Bacteroidota bacterium]|nr:helix-turn-helix transcriptional regulator [Bacteroidota bacterium]